MANFVAMNVQQPNNIKWSENILIADAGYIDKIAFDLIVNFERMLGRPIPPADIARWIDCIALDGGLRAGDHDTQVILLHEKDTKRLENFLPADFKQDLDGKAFKDSLGEFVLSSIAYEDVVKKEDLLLDIIETVSSKKEVKRIMIVPDAEQDGLWDAIRHTLQQVDEEKRITLFAMQPLMGGNFRQEILGYSLLQALGIKGEELKG